MNLLGIYGMRSLYYMLLTDDETRKWLISTVECGEEFYSKGFARKQKYEKNKGYSPQ